jgi:signal peptidase II
VKKSLAIILAVLLADQGLKLWVKTHMMLGQEIHVADWFIIHFTENVGMAFGMEFGGDYGKLFLSVFRIIAVAGIGYYLFKHAVRSPFVVVPVALSLVFAGALGNIIDSTFYGPIFSESFGQVAEVFPADGGYAPMLFGRVVDMLYFPIIEGHFPTWFPVWPNEHYLFFRPVFNIADSSITVGMGLIILFQKKFFV